MTSPSTSSAAALGCVQSVTSEHVALHHLGRLESDFRVTLASSNAERYSLVSHNADGLVCHDAIGTEARMFWDSCVCVTHPP